MNPKIDRVFVVTYGRSGSTLLQGLLNAIPGYRIYGENAGFLFKLQESYEALLFAHSHLGNPKNDNESQPWFGSSRYDEESVTLEFRRFVNKMLFQPFQDRAYRVFGFKEIRFNEIEYEKIEKYIQFIKKLFPNSAIIFNTRNIGDVLKSGWWRSNYWAGLPKQLSDFHDFCDRYVDRHPDYAIHISYDELIRPDRAEVRRLLAFLGETLAEAELERVFRGNHSYENRTITSYLAGRLDYITLEQPEWWRRNVDEFRLEIAPAANGYFLAGVFLPAIGTSARLHIDVGGHRIELVGARPTPKLEMLFTANPAAALSGFEVEIPPGEIMYLRGCSNAGAEVTVGSVRPARAVAARRVASKGGGRDGAGVR